MMKLPNRLFFTGVPGSRWSGIAQTLETCQAFNTSDRTETRKYEHGSFSGHLGAYFGRGMEFEPELNEQNLDAPWIDFATPTKIIKSHDWAYKLLEVEKFAKQSGDWLMIVHRDPESSYDWWVKAGGFDIKYPSYESYKNLPFMRTQIELQTLLIEKFVHDRNLILSPFNSDWVRLNFGLDILVDTSKLTDIKVTLLK